MLPKTYYYICKSPLSITVEVIVEVEVLMDQMLLILTYEEPNTREERLRRSGSLDRATELRRYY